MDKPLLPSLAAGQGPFQIVARAAGRRGSAFLLGLGLLGAAPAALAQTPTIYGIATITQTVTPQLTAGTQGIYQIDPGTGAASDPTGQGNMVSLPGLPIGLPAPLVITGVTATQKLVGFDARPSNRLFYALGYDPAAASGTNNYQLYTLNPTTGVATKVPGVGSSTRLELGNTDRIGFDFDPTTDEVVVTSAATTNNYRLDPATGLSTGGDVSLAAAYTAGTLAGKTPALGTLAFSNSYGRGTSTLYAIDELNTDASDNRFLVTQSPTPGGALSTLGAIRLQFSATGIYAVGASKALDLDLYFNPATGKNEAYMIQVTPPTVDPITQQTQPSSTNFLSPNPVSNFPSLVFERRLNFGNNTVPAILPVEIRDIAAGIAQAPATLTWDGSESTEWKNALNWTPAFVPTATTDVLIPGGGTTPHDPTVSDAEQAKSVTLTTGALLTTANGGTLSVFGNFTNNGGAVDGDGAGVIALTSAANQTIGGSAATTFFNLNVGASGATLASPAAIKRLLTLNGNLTTSGQTFTLLSTVGDGITEQGQVVNIGTATVVGNATVQRAIDGSLNQGIGYRHYSSPVAAANVSDLNSSTGSGFTAVLTQSYNDPANTTPRATTPFPTVFGYDQDLIATSAATDQKSSFDKGYFVPTDGFVAGNRRAGLQPGRGYAVNIADNVTVDFVGQLNNGTLTMSGLRHDADPRAGYHFLGNPYPSAVDWNLLTRSQLEPSLYVFKSTGQYTGFYSSYNNSKSVNTGTNVLPLGQGFFVRALPGATSASLTFTNAARLTTYDATPFQRGTTDERPTLTLALRNAAGRGEQTMIYFEQGATPAYEAAFDAYHLPAPGAPLSLATAGSLSISGQPALTGADVTVPLELSGAATGTYSLAVDALSNLPARYHAFLRDALTGTATELSAQSRLSLSLKAGAPAAGRYAVVFSTQAQALATAPAALAQLAGVYPNPAHGTAAMVLPAALRGGQATPVQLINSLGQVVLRRTLAAGASTPLELPLTGLAAGIYTVRAQTAMGQVVKRLTVE